MSIKFPRFVLATAICLAPMASFAGGPTGISEEAAPETVRKVKKLPAGKLTNGQIALGIIGVGLLAVAISDSGNSTSGTN